jgi:hypothetical protein
MNFFKDFKTEWKFFAVIAAISIVVASALLWYIEATKQEMQQITQEQLIISPSPQEKLDEATDGFVESRKIICSPETLGAVQEDGDGLAPRYVPPKSDTITIPPGRSHERIILKFHEGTDVRLRDGKLLSLKNFDLSPFESALDAYPEPQIVRLSSRSEEELAQEKVRLEAKTGRQETDMNLFYKIILVPETDALTLLNALNTLCIVETVYPAPLATPTGPPIVP